MVNISALVMSKHLFNFLPKIKTRLFRNSRLDGQLTQLDSSEWGRRMIFPHHPAQEVGVCFIEVWVIHSLLQRCRVSCPLWERSPSARDTPPSVYYHPICDLCRVFLSLMDSVSSCLSGCSACVINRLIVSPLRSVWFLLPLSSLLVGSTLFF